MSSMTVDSTSVADRFVEVWNLAEPSLRAKRMRETCVEDVRYVNSNEEVQGYDGLDRIVAALQTEYPDFRVGRTSSVDAHRGGLRFTWQFLDPSGQAVASGMEVATLSADGRLQNIISFNEAQPAVKE